MLKSLLAATLAAVFIVAGETPATIAQEPAQQLSGAPAQAQLRDEIARMTSLSPREIEVHVTLVMIRIVLVNTGYNDDPPPAREYLASTISALINKNAEKDARFKPILVLHVEFVKRGLGFTKFVDTVEFRKQPDGAFARHQS
jgi:hypothetical protein